jgi:hypothetical protein
MITIDMDENKITLIRKWFEPQSGNDIARIIDKYGLDLETKDVIQSLIQLLYFRIEETIILTEEAENIRLWLGQTTWEDTQYVTDKYDLDIDGDETENALLDLYCELGDKLEELGVEI